MEPASAVGWFAAGRLLATVLLGCGVGWLFGNPFGGLAIALALHLAWVLANLMRVEWWLRHRNYAQPPDIGGAWGEIIAQVVRLHRRKRFHKQRFVQLVRQLQRSTAALPDGVVILNAQREIVWFNPTAARLLSLRRGADLGLRIEHLLREPEFVRYLERRDYGNPVVIHPPTGADCYLSLQVIPYGEGQLLLLASDVSRQMRLEAMRRDFVANASHELRSPLTVIAGYLETLAADAALAPELRGPIAEMRRQAARMTAIIRDLLELSRLEEGEGASSGEPLDVAALAVLLRKDVLARAQHPREVRLRIDADAHLLGDEPEIHAAFSNLVDNAAKYTPVEGAIELRWWVDETGGHFAVADTGVGIAPEHLPRLTERFYRVDPGRSRATGGSGLGLAIVKHVLQRHDATLEVHSTFGSGSTFTCHFPAARVLASTGAASAATA